MLHARKFWPKIVKASLWYYALLADIKRHNELTLDEHGKSPLEKFSDTHDKLHCNDFHTWGCPIFVLKEADQSGIIGTLKWEPRGRASVYLGHSPFHSGNDAPVLNLMTGYASPQYHVVFDDDFTTVDYIQSGDEPPNWCNLCTDSSEQVIDEQYDLATTWYDDTLADKTEGGLKIHEHGPPSEEN